MNLSRNQHTIATHCEVRGRGYWTAADVRVVMRPAPLGTGIQLIRRDLPGQPECRAHVAQRTDANLRTNVSSGPAKFEMIEHLMAALYAMEIDNCNVEIDSMELPGLDGSSKPYIEALSQAGLVIQAAQQPQLVIEQLITLRDGASWISASPSPTGTGQFSYHLDFDTPGLIPSQSFSFACSPMRFARELSDARTFVTKTQADQLHAQGVAKHVTYQDLLVFGDDGPIDNALRYPNECARHKTLDLVGDLALTGIDLIGKFVSYRGGHQLNGRMARALYDLALQTQRRRRQIDQSKAA